MAISWIFIDLRTPIAAEISLEDNLVETMINLTRVVINRKNI